MKATMNLQQAQQYIKDAGEDGPDFFPTAMLNNAGRAAVSQFIQDNAKNPSAHNLIAWDDDAANEAMDLLSGQSAIIEMPGRMTTTGNPATLNITADMVDFCVER